MALLARWRADQLVFEDTSGTDAAENADGLAAWGIYEGSQAGSLATQSTSGNRPIWNSSDGGYPSVSVTRSSVQRLNLSHSAAWAVTAFSWLAVVKIDTTAIGLPHLWGRGSGWTNAGVMACADPFGANIYSALLFHAHYERPVQIARPSMSSSTWFVVAGTADGTDICSYVNRQSASRLSLARTVDFGTSALTLFGDGSASSNYHTTGAAREFAFWNTALTGAEMNTEIDAAMTRWGITNTVTPPTASSAKPSHPMSQQVIG